MIVIFSIAKDSSTPEVINGFYFDPTILVLRINNDSQDTVLKKIISDKDLEIHFEQNSKEYNLLNARVTWYRKGGNLLSSEVKPRKKYYRVS